MATRGDSKFKEESLRVCKKEEDCQTWIFEMQMFIEERNVELGEMPDLTEEDEDERESLHPLERLEDVERCLAITKDQLEQWQSSLSRRETRERKSMLRKFSRSLGKKFSHLVRMGPLDIALAIARVRQHFEATEEEDVDELWDEFNSFRIGDLEPSVYCERVMTMADRLNDLGKSTNSHSIKSALLRGIKEDARFADYHRVARFAKKSTKISKMVKDIIREASRSSEDSVSQIQVPKTSKQGDFESMKKKIELLEAENQKLKSSGGPSGDAAADSKKNSGREGSEVLDVWRGRTHQARLPETCGKEAKRKETDSR